MRQASQAFEARDSQIRRTSMSSMASGIPINNASANDHLTTSRIANAQPTYDFNTGTSIAQPLRQTLRQPQLIRPDIGNEDLRAQVKTLQYELDSVKRECETTTLRHGKELRNAQLKAEADFKRAQASESSNHITGHKYEVLAKDLKNTQEQSANQQQDLEKELRILQERNHSLQEDLDDAKTELATLGRQHKHRLQEIDSKHATLQKTLVDLRSDLEAKSSALQTSQGRLSQKEGDVGNLESEILRLKAQAGDNETLMVVKRELSEQIAHIKKLESANREQTTEIKHLRRVHRAVEVVEEEKRALEHKVRHIDDLRKEVTEAQLQRQMLEDERQSWISYLRLEGINFDTPEALARSLVQVRLEKASLLERLGAVQPQISEKDEIIKSLEAEKHVVKIEMERLRGSIGGNESRVKARLERQRALAVKEVDYLREQLRTFDNEETVYQPENKFDEQKTKRILDLESLVDQYRAELKALNDDLTDRQETQPAPEHQSLKRPREEESDERLGQLYRKNRTLQDELFSLQQSTALLNREFNATKSQLSSLKNSSRTRILELCSNPTADAEALKISTLTSLRAENKELLSQLEGRPYGTKVVPISTLDNVRGEMKEMEKIIAEKEKRMLRLKQIWSLKSLEFREAVASLLGWKMDFMPNGRFRMTSIFNAGEQEEDDNDGGNSLVFDGETGTMKIGGGPQSEFAHEIRGLIRFWVEERKEIPGFLAAATLEFYDKTTKAARM